MIKILNNFLSSGHHFLKDENLQKFRFSLLNTFMFISIIFAFIHILASMFGLLEYNQIFLLSLFFFMLIAMSSQYFLRREKSHYFFVVNIFLLGSASLFYFVLFTHPEDEFRLIAFFLLVFIAFVLRGKIFGIFLALFIFLSILLIKNYFNLNLSSYAFATFFTFFIIFSTFLYFFMQKIEKDATEFNLLNKQLKEKVSIELKERQKQEQMLIQQYKMAKMGEMMDAITHQWKQPLMGINSIALNIDRAMEMKNDSTYIDSKVSELLSLTTYMSNTIDDFRTLLSEEKIKIHFSIREAIEHTCELLENILLDVDIQIKGSSSITFYGCVNEFMQVIIILLRNAIEVLTLKNIEYKEIIIIINNSDMLTVSIEDNAGGIDKRDLAYIFEPYFTTKKSSGGTGLGLYIAKIIIEQNTDANLNAINTQKGAKFTIKL